MSAYCDAACETNPSLANRSSAASSPDASPRNHVKALHSSPAVASVNRTLSAAGVELGIPPSSQDHSPADVGPQQREEHHRDCADAHRRPQRKFEQYPRPARRSPQPIPYQQPSDQNRGDEDQQALDHVYLR
jgi:hypothetical protein